MVFPDDEMKHTCHRVELTRLGDRLGVRLGCFDEVTSTNDLARSEIYGHGDMVVAGSQTKGRGQRGNSWESGAWSNLTFSLVLEPHFLPAAYQFLLSEAVSLAVADTLAAYGLDACIKWPNDIYIGTRKVAGILIENDIMGPNISRSIVGIGLNVNQTEFVPSLPNPVSMSMAAGRGFGIADVLSCFYDAFIIRYKALEAGDTEPLEHAYHEKLYLFGVPHIYRLPDGKRFEGVIKRVEPSGMLVVGHADGSTNGYLFKEIEF